MEISIYETEEELEGGTGWDGMGSSEKCEITKLKPSQAYTYRAINQRKSRRNETELLVNYSFASQSHWWQQTRHAGWLSDWLSEWVAIVCCLLHFILTSRIASSIFRAASSWKTRPDQTEGSGIIIINLNWKKRAKAKINYDFWNISICKNPKSFFFRSKLEKEKKKLTTNNNIEPSRAEPSPMRALVSFSFSLVSYVSVFGDCKKI